MLVIFKPRAEYGIALITTDILVIWIYLVFLTFGLALFRFYGATFIKSTFFNAINFYLLLFYIGASL